jgi:hypothetical protein
VEQFLESEVILVSFHSQDSQETRMLLCHKRITFKSFFNMKIPVIPVNNSAFIKLTEFQRACNVGRVLLNFQYK